MSMTIVDLGTKFGKSISTFLMRSPTFFPTHVQSSTEIECVGVDKDDIYRGDIEGMGHSFLCGDVCDAVFRESLPKADFYLVCNILHHLASRDVADEVIRYALRAAELGVWFRVKSFEEDAVNGEGILMAQELRFCWSREHSSYSVSEISALVRETLPEASIRVEPAKRIRHTKDKRVVPADTKTDAFFYDVAMGPKVYMELPKPVVCEWDIFVENNVHEVNTDKA